MAESISGEAGVQLRLDARAASAVDCYSDYSKVSFIIDGYERPLYRGQRQFPAEIRAFDSDEEELTLNLYGDSNGRLFELEVIRWGGGRSFLQGGIRCLFSDVSGWNLVGCV